MRQLGAVLGLALVLSAALPGAADAASIERTFSAVGNEPFGVTIDPSDGRVYVANSDHESPNSGFLSVIDSAFPPCPPYPCGLRPIALASPPTMSALDPGLRRLFVTTANRTLTFVDLATQSVAKTIPNAGGLGVAVDEATHHVYAAAVTSLSMVDGVTGDVLHTASAGPGDSWWAVALDVGAHRVYVTNLDASTPSLVILNSDDLALIGEVVLPEVPRLALAVDTTRQLVYVGGYSDAGRLYVVDANTRQITSVVDLQAGPTRPFSATLVVAQDRLYLSQIASSFNPNANSIVVLDLATRQVVQRISLPWQPGQTALHANGRLFVAGFSAHLVAVVNLTNSAPVVDNVTFSPSSPSTNDVLVANVATHDADNDLLTYTYEWLRNGSLLSNAAGPSLDLSLAGHGDRGDTITVHVTVSDPGGLTATATSSVLIANAAPAVTVRLNNPEPRTNDILMAVVAAPDAEGDPVTLVYEWYRNGARIAGASGTTLDLGTYGDRGDLIAVAVTASDDHGGVRQVTASTTIVDSLALVTVSLSTTSPTTNELLFATAIGTDADGDQIYYSWQLLANGVAVAGAGPAYSVLFDLSTPGWGSRGDALEVRVQPWSNGQYGPTAAASAVVVNAAPSVAVSLSDTTPKVGDVLVASASGEDADGDAFTYTYTWRVNGLVKRTVTTTSVTDSFDTAGRTNPRGGQVTVELVGNDGFTASPPASATAFFRGGNK